MPHNDSAVNSLIFKVMRAFDLPHPGDDQLRRPEESVPVEEVTRRRSYLMNHAQEVFAHFGLSMPEGGLQELQRGIDGDEGRNGVQLELSPEKGIDRRLPWHAGTMLTRFALNSVVTKAIYSKAQAPAEEASVAHLEPVGV